MTESLIGTIQRLTPDDCVTLQELDGPNGKLRVRQHGQYRWLQMADASIQSLVDVRAPSRVLSPSVVLMLMGLAFTQGRSRLLNLGLGGGAIERYLRIDFPDLVVESVEVDSLVVAAAREHFMLPDSQIVHEQDAERFIANASGHYDLVLCDLFFADQLAPCVERSSFFADIKRCLSPGGVCVMNLLYTDQNALVNALKAARTHLPATWLIEIQGHQNVIAYFMHERTEDDAELQLACKQIVQTLDAEPLSFDWELTSLPERQP